MTLRVQRRVDTAVAIADGATRNYDFKIHVPRIEGDEVLAGRQVNIFISLSVIGELRVQYSNDGGATFIDRGTIDPLAAGVPFFDTIPAIGTDLRIEVTNSSGGPGTITAVIHLV